jgi:hypothetical protein
MCLKGFSGKEPVNPDLVPGTRPTLRRLIVSNKIEAPEPAPEKKSSGIFLWLFIGLNAAMAILVIIKFLFS